MGVVATNNIEPRKSKTISNQGRRTLLGHFMSGRDVRRDEEI